jgi:hypothetical protein
VFIREAIFLCFPPIYAEQVFHEEPDEAKKNMKTVELANGGSVMTAHSTITHAPVTLRDQDRTGQEVCRPERTDLRRRIESLLHEIFEGHEEFLGCTPD